MRVSTAIGAGILSVIAFAGLFSGFMPYDVITDVDISIAGQAPSFEHWLGTDHIGRDVALRTLIASNAFVGPGIFACLIAILLGVSAGATSGYLGGIPSSIIRFVSTVTASLPRFILVLLAIAIYGNSTWLIGAVTGIAYAPTIAEAIHSRIDSLRRAEFVSAAQAHGLSELKILIYHLLWVNCRELVARHALSLFGYLLLLETTLSYIGGFGVMEPQPSWGNMLAFEFGHRTDNIWGLWAPAIAIWITILATTLVSESLLENTRGKND